MLDVYSVKVSASMCFFPYKEKIYPLLMLTMNNVFVEIISKNLTI